MKDRKAAHGLGKGSVQVQVWERRFAGNWMLCGCQIVHLSAEFGTWRCGW